MSLNFLNRFTHRAMYRSNNYTSTYGISKYLSVLNVILPVLLFKRNRFFFHIAIITIMTINFNFYSYALEGVGYTEIKVNEETYSVPIPNHKTGNDFYFLKKALNGDTEAREMLLGGQDERFFFVGDIGVVRWLRLTMTDAEVMERR